MNIYKNILIILILSFTQSSYSNSSQLIDWNDKQLKWYNYVDGMEKIKESGKPGILIIYADWCPTCKQYSGLFDNKDVVKSVKDLILIRVNKDLNEVISKKYSIDGEYVPRTFALNNKGKVMKKFYSEKDKYTYFLPSNDSVYLIQFTKLILLYGK